MKGVYLRNRFFIAMGFVIVCFMVSYSFPFLFIASKILLGLVILVALLDLIILNQAKKQTLASRYVHPKLSLSDEQSIKYQLKNDSKLNLKFSLTDELPFQFQHRSAIKEVDLAKESYVDIAHKVRPVIRGLYHFGDLQLFISNPIISFVELKTTIPAIKEVMVVPSIIQMKKYELQVFSRTANLSGVRRIRQIGENDEFEHIRSYSQGDNIKAINWKATSRKNQVMVNQYQNSRSQNVYCLIDKGRSMKMPFNELTLLDYAINTSLVIANIVLRKYDRAGLITFSDKIGSLVKAESTPHQLERISKKLYDQKTGFRESNFELLFYTLRKQLSRRSVLLFFTNFENDHDLDRNLQYLRSINKKHLLVVIFFINTELIEASEMVCHAKADIYLKTFAQKTLIDKERLMNKLESNGIKTILTKPEDLSINVINKYLEIKAKRQG